jgi:hypothetical protein
MHKEFTVHKLNENGILHAKDIALAFDNLLKNLEACCDDGRTLAITRTKLEEACFFAKKAMAENPKNQEQL